jgi:hypothetical protein
VRATHTRVCTRSQPCDSCVRVHVSSSRGVLRVCTRLRTIGVSARPAPTMHRCSSICQSTTNGATIDIFHFPSLFSTLVQLCGWCLTAPAFCKVACVPSPCQVHSTQCISSQPLTPLSLSSPSLPVCSWQVSTALGTETPLPQAHEALDPSGRLTNASAASAAALYHGIFSRLNATLGSDLSYYWFWSPEG